MQREDCKNRAIQSVAIQTDVFERNEGSCQTFSPEREDVQVQACVRQSEPIATQTDISPKCDFQVQANIQPDNDSKAVQTIKQEITMPNIPNSAAQTPAKKRKLSTNDASSALQSTRHRSGDKSDEVNNDQALNLEPTMSETTKEEIAMPNSPTQAGTPLVKLPRFLKRRQVAMPAERKTKPVQAKDVKERFIFYPTKDGNPVCYFLRVIQ